ncbi:hypothetical protein D9M68_843120 [compost metagenome]
MIFREGGELGVLRHQRFFVRVRQRQAQALQGITQGLAGQVPEGPVVAAAVFAVGVRQRNQARVFDLFFAPDRRDRRALTGIQTFGQRADRIHVEQGAVGIKNNRLNGHGQRSGVWCFSARRFSGTGSRSPAF